MADSILVQSDSRERVAFELWRAHIGSLPEARGEDYIARSLALFARCRRAAYGAKD